MKKLVTLIVSLACNSVFAGTGWYVTVHNESGQSIQATGKGGGGNQCWYSNGFNDDNDINPGESKTIYTEEKNSSSDGDTCFTDRVKYQKISVNGKQISLFSHYNGGLADPISAYRYVKNERPNDGDINKMLWAAQAKSVTDTVYVDIYVTNNGIDLRSMSF